jgi:hypothetical protein
LFAKELVEAKEAEVEAPKNEPEKDPLKDPLKEPVTEAADPETLIASNPYRPIFAVLSEKISMTGIPEISLTENRDPES